ncbi:MAG: amidohydrolase family protein, partial [Planctomycetota bacterium]
MIINCHCHIFCLEDVPRDFRERFFLDRQSRRHRVVDRQLRRALPQDNKVREWWELADLSTETIAQRLVEEMDEAGVDMATPLMMDMAFCSGYTGEVRPYEDQITATCEAVRDANDTSSCNRLLPFIAADPRRDNVVDLVTKNLERECFAGVKMYPVMGFTPDDRRLYPLYEYCEHHDVPITTHCQWGGIPGLHDYYDLADPDYWETVLDDFPALTVNLAHNGHPGSPWQRQIRRIILNNPNVYTDLSYALAMWIIPWLYFRQVRKMLRTPHLQDRVLYGTDWYMGRCFWTEQSYLDWFTRR